MIDEAPRVDWKEGIQKRMYGSTFEQLDQEWQNDRIYVEDGPITLAAFLTGKVSLMLHECDGRTIDAETYQAVRQNLQSIQRLLRNHAQRI